MKKLLSLILSLIFCLTLVSCSFDFSLDALGLRDKKEEKVVMYGIGVHLEDFNNTCIYFADAGHISMPRLKSGEPSPEFTVGDLIRVTFTTDENGIAIMESFPGQIGLGADEITVKPGEVDFYILEEERFFSDIIPEGLSLEVGDTLLLSSTALGAKKEVAEGVVTEQDGERYTVKLTSFGSDKDFFTYLFEYGFSVEEK